MIAVVDFVFFLFKSLLQFISLSILVWAIIGWLIAFDIINLRNRFVASVYYFLDGLARPLLYPIQRMIPPLGGVDISPIIALLIIQGMQRFLIPAAEAAAYGALGGA